MPYNNNDLPTPRLRDSGRALGHEPYYLNDIPKEVIRSIGGYFIYLLHMGRKDITGEDWGDAFAEAVKGKHLDSPLGIADVVSGRMAFSMKTVKTSNPFTVEHVRLISGRCSPDYSYGIGDPHEDIQRTGRAVLEIWNERVNIAHDHYNPVRTSILVRANDLLSYTIFEEDTNRFNTSEYEWRENRNGNLEGYIAGTDVKRFVWQPHGSQFTIITKVPAFAKKFRIRKPPIISKESILEALHFDEDWIQIL